METETGMKYAKLTKTKHSKEQGGTKTELAATLLSKTNDENESQVR